LFIWLNSSSYDLYLCFISLSLSTCSLSTNSLSTNSLSTVPKKHLNIITGNLLGDGFIQRAKPQENKIVSKKGRYAMTSSTKNSPYLIYLFETVYKTYSLSGLRPYPNPNLPQHKGKEITQYTFCTCYDPLFTYLHSIWYN
jgi:hypothetical protein